MWWSQTCHRDADRGQLAIAMGHLAHRAGALRELGSDLHHESLAIAHGICEVFKKMVRDFANR